MSKIKKDKDELTKSDRVKIKITSDESSLKKKPERSKIKDEEVTTSESNVFFDPQKTKRSLQVQFMIILLLGSLLIYFNKFGGTGQIIASVVVMGLYIFINIKKTKGIPVIRAVFADSVYYLGFLFTFVALVVAMMELTKEGFEIKYIVGTMGPALVTTIIGMAFRIYYTQFDPITDEPVTETVNTLGSLSANLITAMENLDKSSANNSKAFEEFQKNSSKQMEDFAKTLTKLDFGKTSSQLQTLSETLDRINIVGNSLREETNRSKLKMDETNSELNQLDNTIKNVNQKLANVSDLETDLSELNKKISSSKDEISNSLETTKKTLADVSNKMNEGVRFASTEINLSAAKITKEFNEAETQARDFKSAIKTSLNDVVDFLNRHK